MFRRRNDNAHAPPCHRVRVHLSAAADGEVSIEPSSAMAEHLRRCADCRRYERRIVLLNRHLRINVLEPVPDLTAPILENIAVLSQIDTHVVAPHRMGATGTQRLARWAVALIPLGLAVSSFASGALAKPHIVPSYPVTPCTKALAHHYKTQP